MYGDYELPFFVEKEGISVSVEKNDSMWVYRRTLGIDTEEKIILGDGKHIIINPVEPLKTPKEITPYLLIEFEKALFLDGKTRAKIFLTFPIEIGVFIADKGNKNLQLLDVFTLARQKFTLYGPISDGIICKHWKSGIYSVPPSPNPLQEGIMELSLRNVTSDWVSISQVVFNAYTMKLYYDANVHMKAQMNITSKYTAETGFEFRNIKGELKSYYLKNQDNRNKAIEVYNQKFDIAHLKFEMIWGFFVDE
jgi:hypothetical protein